jgi:hypothetical protein
MDNKDNFIVLKLFKRPEHGGRSPEGKSEIQRRRSTPIRRLTQRQHKQGFFG